MTINCSFSITGIRHDDVVDDLMIVPNMITHVGLSYLAATKKFKSAEEKFNFHDSFNAFFLGGDDTPVSFDDNGLKDLKLTIPTSNESNTSYTYSSVRSDDITIPAGTYNELAIGYHDLLNGNNYYYNRAVLETPLVIDEQFYKTYRGISINYVFTTQSNLGYGRLSTIDINGKTFNVSTYTTEPSYGNVGNLKNNFFESDKGTIAGYRGTIQSATGTMTYVGVENDAHRLMELKLTSKVADTDAVVENVYVYCGSLLHYIHLADVDGNGVIIPAGKTLTLQLEVFYFSDRYTHSKLAEADAGIGINSATLDLSSYTVYYNKSTILNGYAINIETNERIEYPRLTFFYNEADMVNYPIDETSVMLKDAVNIADTDTHYVELDRTGIWKVYLNYVNQSNLLSTVVTGTKSGKTYTFAAPTYTYDSTAGNTRLKLNNRPTQATHVRIYNSAKDKISTLPITTVDGVAYVILDAEHVHLYYSTNPGVASIRYYSETNPSLLGIWYTNPGQFNLSTNVVTIEENPNLVPAGALQRPITRFQYDRANLIVRGQMNGGNKVRIKEVDGSEVHEFDVEPFKTFEIDITDTEIKVSKNYRIVAVGELGESDGPTFKGFASSTVSPITDAVYNKSNLSITFTQPDEFVKFATLKRWNFEFYRLELKSGTNVLYLSEALAEEGQWELYALDENSTESRPFYIFGEKPADLPVKPANTPPVLTAVANSSSNYLVSGIGFYPPKTDAFEWWSNVTWHATINGVDAQVEFLGLESYYDKVQYPSSYAPFLAFRISNQEDVISYKLQAGNGTTLDGKWRVESGYTKTMLDLKLWHDWVPYDGHPESDMYSNSGRNTSGRIYGTGNGYHQVTEVQSGFIRRAIGLQFNFNWYGNGVMGGCPINFDSQYSQNVGITQPPATVDMLSYMQVHVGKRIKNAGDPVAMLNDFVVDGLSVLINGKGSTITDSVTLMNGSYKYYTSITWTNTEGVSYIYNVESGYFTRTDREEHMDDPAYSQVVDTIQLCYNEAAKTNMSAHYIFQSSTVAGSLAFPPHIRMLTNGNLWQSVKGWLRPYRTVGGDMMLLPSDIENPKIVSMQYDFNFDKSLLDAKNELLITLNGEPAEIIDPPEGTMRINAISRLDRVGVYHQYPRAAAVPGHLIDLYDSVPLPAQMQVIPYVVTETESTANAVYNSNDYNVMDATFLPPIPNEYEAYRLSLDNADEYLTWYELMPIVEYRNNTLGIVESRLPVELRTKKVCLPRLWARMHIDVINEHRVNSPDLILFGNGYAVASATYNDYALRLKNNAFEDPSLMWNIGNSTVIMGYYEFEFKDVLKQTVLNYGLIKGRNGGVTHNTAVYKNAEVAATDGFKNPGEITEFYNTLMHRPRYHPSQPYHYLIPADEATSKQLSTLIFGEEREYIAIKNTNASIFTHKQLIDQCMIGGYFNVKEALKRWTSGKLLICLGIGANAAITERYEMSRDSTGARRILGVDNSDIDSYFTNMFEGKICYDNTVILDYVEIDLGTAAEEANRIDSDVHYIPYVNGSLSNHARLGVTFDGFVPPPTIGRDQMLWDAERKEFVLSHTATMYGFDVNEPEMKPRRLVSENYELAEIPGYAGKWNLVRWKDDRVVGINSAKIGYPQVKLLVTTKQFNSENIFISSLTEPMIKIDGDNYGHYINLVNSPTNPATSNPGNILPFTDPRNLQILNEYYVYSDTNSVGWSIFGVIAAVTGLTGGFLTNYFPMSWGDELVTVEPVPGTAYPATNFPEPYYVEIPVARIYKQDGTLLASLTVMYQGRYSRQVSMTMHQETPTGLNKVAMVLFGAGSYRTALLNTSGVIALNQNDYYLAVGYINYDYSQLPELNNYDVWHWDNYTDRNSVSDLIYDQSGAAPFPAWHLVQTLSDFNANFNIYIDGNLASLSETTRTDILANEEITATVYTATYGAITIDMYYSDVFGCYKRDIVIDSTTNKTVEFVIESNRSFVIKYDVAAYVPVFNAVEIAWDGSHVDSYDASTNNISASNYLTSGNIYDNGESPVFFKPTVYYSFYNPNYIDQDIGKRNAWKEAVNQSFSAANAAVALELDDMYSAFSATEEHDSFFKKELIPYFHSEFSVLNLGFYLHNGKLPTHWSTYNNFSESHHSSGDKEYNFDYSLYLSIEWDEEGLPIPNSGESYGYFSQYTNTSSIDLTVPYISLSTVMLPLDNMLSEDELYTFLNGGSYSRSVLTTESSTFSEGEDAEEIFTFDGTYMIVPDAYTENGDNVIAPVNDILTELQTREVPDYMRLITEVITNQLTGESAEVVHLFAINPWYDPDILNKINMFKENTPEKRNSSNVDIFWDCDDTNYHEGNTRVTFNDGTSPDNVSMYTSLTSDGYMSLNHEYSYRKNGQYSSIAYEARYSEFELEYVDWYTNGLGNQIIYCDLVHVTDWYTVDYTSREFYFYIPGNSSYSTVDEIQLYIEENPECGMYVERQVRINTAFYDEPIEEYRYVILQRRFSTRYVEPFDAYAISPKDYLETLLMNEIPTGMSKHEAILSLADDESNVCSINNMPMPHITLFQSMQENIYFHQSSSLLLNWLQSECTVDHFNNVFYLELNGEELEFISYNFDIDQSVITVVAESDSFSVTYTYSDVTATVDEAPYLPLQFIASHVVVLKNPELNTFITGIYSTKRWPVGYAEGTDPNESANWWPEADWIIPFDYSNVSDNISYEDDWANGITRYYLYPNSRAGAGESMEAYEDRSAAVGRYHYQVLTINSVDNLEIDPDGGFMRSYEIITNLPSLYADDEDNGGDDNPPEAT